MEASPNRSILQLSTCTRQRHSGRRQIWPSLSFHFEVEIPKFQCLSVKTQPLASLCVCLLLFFKKSSLLNAGFRQTSRHFCMVLGLWSVPGKGWASGLQEVLPVGQKVKGDSLVLITFLYKWFVLAAVFLWLFSRSHSLPLHPFFLFCFYFVCFNCECHSLFTGLVLC